MDNSIFQFFSMNGTSENFHILFTHHHSLEKFLVGTFYHLVTFPSQGAGLLLEIICKMTLNDVNFIFHVFTTQ